jgi:multicomponent Na+:H+ antiporter subunit F
MTAFLLGALLAVGVLIILGLARVWLGPTIFDRLIAVALVSVNGVVIIVLLGFYFERPVFFLDIALGYALLAFLVPIALGRYFEGTGHR